MLKNGLRVKYSQLRSLLSSQNILDNSLNIANASLQLPIWQLHYYHVFLPIENKKEVDTEGLISIILGKDKNLIVPKVISETQLSHYLLTDNTKFKTNSWGVPEPEDGILIAPKNIDVVFIPLLAFDLQGNRIGYGKGYYDRFLSECRKDVIKIGLSFFEAEDKIEDISVDDIPLNYCITPTKTYSFDSTPNC
jgi:5-formyltetrahydrofolate cyclo-ligase